MLNSQRRHDEAGNLALRELDKHFRKPLLIYFRRRLGGHREDAEDLTQEVFVRLARNPDKNDGATLEGYVFMIAGSVLTDWRRQRSTRRLDAHDDLDNVTEGVTFPSNLIEHRSPERVLTDREALQRVEKALAQLNERTRNIFVLYRLERLQRTDIARRLGISVSTVEKEIRKAIAHLREGRL